MVSLKKSKYPLKKKKGGMENGEWQQGFSKLPPACCPTLWRVREQCAHRSRGRCQGRSYFWGASWGHIMVFFSSWGAGVELEVKEWWVVTEFPQLSFYITFPRWFSEQEQCRWYVRVKLFSCVPLCVTPRTVVHQAPLSMGFSRQSGEPTGVGCYALPRLFL